VPFTVKSQNTPPSSITMILAPYANFLTYLLTYLPEVYANATIGCKTQSFLNIIIGLCCFLLVSWYFGEPCDGFRYPKAALH